jgi:hypothetical protein
MRTPEFHAIQARVKTIPPHRRGATAEAIIAPERAVDGRFAQVSLRSEPRKSPVIAVDCAS